MMYILDLLLRLLIFYLEKRHENRTLLTKTLEDISRSYSPTTMTSRTAPKPSQPMRSIMTQILPGFLYLSGITAASSTEKLKAYGITHVLSVLSPSEAPKVPEEIKQLIIDVNDTTTTNLLPHFPEAIAFIKLALSTKNGKVLVHCVEGVSRSSSMVLAYIMSERGLSYKQALRLVKLRRCVACPNIGFERQLKEWEKICTKKRQEEPKPWENILKHKRKCGEESIAHGDGKIARHGPMSWVRWAFGGVPGNGDGP
ncbi:protein-tyrosine phosphatase-like protein [Pyronema omphalodes]|nr:protein-tyrosine phosphatase-like protein [Pyronema omphalodes]